MKKIIAALILVGACVHASAKDVVTRTLPVKDFTGIECNIPCEIEYTVGAANFSVTMPEKLEGHLVAEVKNGLLTIELDKATSFKFGKVSIRLSSSDLSKVKLNGAVDLEIDSKISPDAFEATLNGASDLEIHGLDADSVTISSNGSAEINVENLVCESIKVTVNGTGDCELEGFARNADLTVNGVGGIDIKKLKTENMNSAINGLGKISRD